jgi:hypothetical protein
MESLAELKSRMQVLAENSTYTVSCDMKIAGHQPGAEPVRFYFDKS